MTSKGNITHYTSGTQLCRKVETEIRKQKDTQILAKASGDNDLVYESQNKISLLTKKYNKILKESGLLSQIKRASVIGYSRVAKNKWKYKN